MFMHQLQFEFIIYCYVSFGIICLKLAYLPLHIPVQDVKYI